LASSEFIQVIIDLSACLGTAKCRGCIKVCPVNIFEEEAGYPKVVEENQDECTLCNLCMETCRPKAITIKKLYE